MKLSYRYIEDHGMFYINLINEGGENYAIRDYFVALYLGLTKSDYQNILLKHGAFYAPPNLGLLMDECHFENKEDLERAIEELEPYLVMAALTNAN